MLGSWDDHSGERCVLDAAPESREALGSSDVVVLVIDGLKISSSAGSVSLAVTNVLATPVSASDGLDSLSPVVPTVSFSLTCS